MFLLPKWIMTSKHPAFYDAESGSAIEQTAKVYGAMNKLIEEYNAFVDELNKKINEFEAGVTTSNEEFKTCITTLIENYIKTIDLKLSNQDLVIAENISYIRDNLELFLKQLIAEMKDTGELNEVILSAFDDLDTKFTGLDSRVTTIENSMPYYIYNEETEELELQNIPTRSE